MDERFLASRDDSPQGPNARPARRSIGRLVAQGATEWRVSERTLLGMWAIPFLVAFTGFGTALIGKDCYKWFTGEDGVAENLQVAFYGLALVLGCVVMAHIWRAGQRGIALLYLGVCLGLVFLVGEELSWGQRFFHWATPEVFQSANKQEETNLHNVYGVGYTFKWLQLLVGAYGTVLPLVVYAPKAAARFRGTLSMVVPHYTLIPFFAFLLVWRTYRNLFEAPREYYFAISEYNEVMELILAMGFFFFMVFQLRRLKSDKRVEPPLPVTADPGEPIQAPGA